MFGAGSWLFLGWGFQVFAELTGLADLGSAKAFCNERSRVFDVTTWTRVAWGH